MTAVLGKNSPNISLFGLVNFVKWLMFYINLLLFIIKTNAKIWQKLLFANFFREKFNVFR